MADVVCVVRSHVRKVLVGCYDYVGVRFFFFKQKTAYDMRISDWSSDVCSSDLVECARGGARARLRNVQKRVQIGPSPDLRETLADDEIGRASCRERVCQYV